MAFYGRFAFPTLPDPGMNKPEFGFPADRTAILTGKRLSGAPLSVRCSTVSKPQMQEYKDAFENGMSILQWTEKPSKIRETRTEVLEFNKIKNQINLIKEMLRSMGDGETTISAYDTAWVALVEDIHGSGAPQFPSSLQWIVENQLSDGSWGDSQIFCAHDRIINTLACVIALKAWDICSERCERGMSFLRDNMWKLQGEDPELMPIGFEVAFPSLLEIAQKLGLELPYDSPIFSDIYAKKNLKLKRIPKEVLHKVPTTLLHSMEGMPDLDWEKLLKLQNMDGSFLFSPSCTAFAVMQTKDENCFKYLRKVVEKFNGGAPSVYPIDLFEHLWAVDRLQRLGISRYFELEIKNCLDYVYRYWTEDGICWARNSPVLDVDDTSMGFRLLRLHGYEVSADVFRNFEKEGEFFCFAGQSSQAVTGIYNLNRASQVMFPGEQILKAAKSFSFKFLREKQVSNKLLDKWIITKDLAGEVEYALSFPWYASLPRIETRFYIDQYGAENDIWIGKTLYRMPYVSNNIYLELAKLDFNRCQSVHQKEWVDMEKWYRECYLGMRSSGVSKKAVLRTYFLAASTIFEPERALERLAWARSQVLIEAVSFHFSNVAITVEERRAFVQDFSERWVRKGTRKGKGLVWALARTLNLLSLEAVRAHGRDINCQLQRTWETWLLLLCSPQHYNPNPTTNETELLVLTINLCAGHSLSQELLSHPHYTRLARLANNLSLRLSHLRESKSQREEGPDDTHRQTSHAIESDMQELVQCVLQGSDSMAHEVKQAFLNVVKSFYYMAHCPVATVNLHITKLLIERVA